MKLFGDTYIGIYDNALTKKECEILINQFEKLPHSEGGFSRNGVFTVDYNSKKSIDVDNLRLSDNSIVSNIILCRIKECLKKYIREYPLVNRNLQKWGLEEQYNFQKYETEEDGYKNWHTEAGGYATSYRILAWMFYLNNAKSGTEFMRYGKIPAKMGRGLIWPAAWTHVHRSAIPNKGLKYIVTGWGAFLPPEQTA